MFKLPEVRGFEPLEKFLSFSDRRDFLVYLNSLYKLKKQEDLHEMYHQSGTADTSINATLVTFVKNSTAFAKLDLECLDEYFFNNS